MNTFTTTLIAGGRRPYDTWTFVVLPDAVVEALGPPPLAVRGTIAGTPFRATATRGEGVVRIPVTAELRERAGVRRGDSVAVRVEPDPDQRLLDIPPELQEILDADSALVEAWDAMAPSHRRAWVQYVGSSLSRMGWRGRG